MSATVLTDLLDPGRLERLGVDLDGEALTDGTVRRSWRDYVDEVGRLAGALVDVGVRPGDRVGVRMTKSAHSFLAVHAVLRAGAVMVPLDALAPSAHTSGVVADAGVRVLVADRRSARTAADCGVDTVVVPSADVEPDGGRIVDAGAIAAFDPIGPVASDPDDPAYVIYTSGSTGAPKGIVHTHASALAYARAAADEYGLRADDRFANIAPLHFDQSTFELYVAPLVGAAAIVLPDPVLRFPASVSQLVADERATVWYSVPHLLEQLADRGALDERDLSALRWVLFGGESFPPSVLASLMARLPNARWSNVYGPAEVNQCTAFHLVGPPDGAVPLGDAWPAARIALVDADDPRSLRPSPVDVGVVAVASPTMMRGYWQRPDLDASAIVTDAAGERWYLTGDLARRDGEGRLVFVGRVDHQVKVRGHRIELEGVDAALRSVDGVAAATTVVDRSDGEPHLVALVVATDPDDAAQLVDRIGAELRARLPRYAVPDDVRFVDHLARTATGKIDRTAAARWLDDSAPGTGRL